MIISHVEYYAPHTLAHVLVKVTFSLPSLSATNHSDQQI